MSKSISDAGLWSKELLNHCWENRQRNISDDFHLKWFLDYGFSIETDIFGVKRPALPTNHREIQPKIDGR